MLQPSDYSLESPNETASCTHVANSSSSLTASSWSDWTSVPSTTASPFDMPTVGPGYSDALKHLETASVVIGFIGLVLNAFVLLVLYTYQPMHSRLTNTFIANLTAIDCLVSLFLILTRLLTSVVWTNRIPGYWADELVCRLWLTKWPLWAMLTSSTYGILALTFERYLGIVHPIWHRAHFTKNKVRLTIAAVWIIGPAYETVLMVPSSNITPACSCQILTDWPSPSYEEAMRYTTPAVEFVIPLIVLFYFYGRIIHTLSRRRSIGGRRGGRTSVSSLTPLLEANTMPANADKATSNVLKTLALVALFFVLCWSPNEIYYWVYMSGDKRLQFIEWFYHCTVLMVYLNCCINPIIYSIRYEQFKRGTKWLLCLSWRQRRLVSERDFGSSSASYD